VFLQPVSPVRGVEAPPSSLVAALVAMGEERELDVRVVPQLHPRLGVR